MRLVRFDRPFGDIIELGLGFLCTWACLAQHHPPSSFLSSSAVCSLVRFACLVSCRHHLWDSKSVATWSRYFTEMLVPERTRLPARYQRTRSQVRSMLVRYQDHREHRNLAANLHLRSATRVHSCRLCKHSTRAWYAAPPYEAMACNEKPTTIVRLRTNGAQSNVMITWRSNELETTN